MPEITAVLVKELREKTGAGMMDCKKALDQNNCDIEASVDWLRTKGLAAAAKKAGRVAAEGLVGLAVEGNTGAIVEINAETDFVARNEAFQNFVKVVSALALKSDGNIDKLKNMKYHDEQGRTVDEELTHMISTIGENIQLRRISTIKSETETISSYIHNSQGDGIGKIAVLVALRCDENSKQIQDFGKQLAMHIAAAKPKAVSRDDLDPDLLSRERKILVEQAKDSGKPDAIIEKMVDGRIRKFYEEACLLEQTFVMDEDSKIADVIEQKAKDLSLKLSISGFSYFVLGEGIEKREEDFATEVAAAGR